VGPGRLPAEETILFYLRRLLAPKDFAGKKILVTAGPTREPIDLVRFISNRSSGKMGYAIAQRAAERGAQVHLVSGPTALSVPAGVELHAVRSTLDMQRVVDELLAGVDAAILFSDLLIPLLPMKNLEVELVERVGPVIKSTKELSALDKIITTYPVKEHLSYVAEIIKAVKSEAPDTPLIGFCGAPYTLLSYVIEGGSSKNFLKTKQFMYEYPHLFKNALFTLTDILCEYAWMQIEAGVDAFQVFESACLTMNSTDFIRSFFVSWLSPAFWSNLSYARSL